MEAGSGYSFTSGVCWAQQQSLCLCCYCTLIRKSGSSSQILLGRRQRGMCSVPLKELGRGPFLNSDWVQEFQTNSGSWEYSEHSPRRALQWVGLLRLQQGLGCLRGGRLWVWLPNQEQKEATHQTDHGERDEHCLAVLVWNTSHSLQIRTLAVRSPLVLDFMGIINALTQGKNLLNVGQTAFSLHNNLCVKMWKAAHALLVHFFKYYKHISSLTCYMNMSVPGTVNVKISKKHTADRQKILTKQIRITIPRCKSCFSCGRFTLIEKVPKICRYFSQWCCQ